LPIWRHRRRRPVRAPRGAADHLHVRLPPVPLGQRRDLQLHDALPIYLARDAARLFGVLRRDPDRDLVHRRRWRRQPAAERGAGDRPVRRRRQRAPLHHPGPGRAQPAAHPDLRRHRGRGPVRPLRQRADHVQLHLPPVPERQQRDLHHQQPVRGHVARPGARVQRLLGPDPDRELLTALPRGGGRGDLPAAPLFCHHRPTTACGADGMAGNSRMGAIMAAALLLAAGGAGARVAAHAHGTDGLDPMAPVYVVAERGTFHAALRDFTGQALPRVDASGNRLVLATLREHQLEDLIRHVHEVERRCGGYFAFASREEAEAFLRSDTGARALGTPLPAYTVGEQAWLEPWLSQVSEPAIRATIQHLSTAWPNRYFASTHGHAAPVSIRDHWLSLANGRRDVTAELFTACGNCGGQPSVILTINGTDLADEIVVLGGHLDFIYSSGSGTAMVAPGADDEASGIATLTEVLRAAMANGYRPRRTVMFMGYSAEEVGLRGSRAVAQRFAA